MRATLFRAEVGMARSDAGLGQVVIMQPLRLRVLIQLALLSAVALALFVTRVEYPHLVAADGRVGPSAPGEGAHVVVHVPEGALAAVREGARVTVDFAAYPSLRYGTVAGTVVRIEHDAAARFRVHVALARRFVDPQGLRYAIRPGMRARVLFSQERRPLLRWLLGCGPQCARGTQ